MSGVLEIPSLRARVSPITVEEYHLLPEFNANGRRTELIRGIVFEKVRKSPLHATIAGRLFDLLLPQVPTGVCLRQHEPLTLRNSEPEPDILIITGSLGDYLLAHPRTALLAVEVAVTTYEEEQLKALLYAEAEVAEYWIVLPNTQSVEVHRRSVGGRNTESRLFSGDDALRCEGVAGGVVALEELFAGVVAR